MDIPLSTPAVNSGPRTVVFTVGTGNKHYWVSCRYADAIFLFTRNTFRAEQKNHAFIVNKPPKLSYIDARGIDSQ